MNHSEFDIYSARSRATADRHGPVDRLPDDRPDIRWAVAWLALTAIVFITGLALWLS